MKLEGSSVLLTLGTYAMHAEKYMQALYTSKDKDLPNAYIAFMRTLALPIYPEMTEEDVALVITRIEECIF